MTHENVTESPIPQSFVCPSCGALAHQELFELGYWSESIDDLREIPNWQGTRCFSCKQYAMWHNKRRVYPIATTIAMPNPDTPADAKRDFEEARLIADLSPRGAAALLRLCIQKLCVTFGLPGKNLNNDIATLVSQGLDDRIQKALDVVRVTGNHAVHPGELDLQDSSNDVRTLFGLVNEIVEDRISRPKRLDDLYGSLPEKDRANIEKRNEKARQPKS